jgi:hypothetical protein
MRLDLKGRGFQPRRESKFNQPRLPHPARFSQGGHDAAEANGLTWTSHRVVPHSVQISYTQPSKITKPGAAGFSFTTGKRKVGPAPIEASALARFHKVPEVIAARLQPRKPDPVPEYIPQFSGRGLEEIDAEHERLRLQRRLRELKN